jgi:hypothetical protein
LKDECDTCGRWFAYLKYKTRVIKNCSEACTNTWHTIQTAEPERMMELFFYRVKVPRDLNADDIGGLYWHDYSWLELNILLILKVDPTTAPYITEKVFGLSYTKSGQLKHRSAVVSALTRLIEIKMVRKYPTHRHEKIGRPVVKYALTSAIVTLNKKCPHCKNNNYRVKKVEGKVKCIYCGLEWMVPGVKK